MIGNNHLKVNSSVTLLAFLPLFAFTVGIGGDDLRNGVETNLSVFCDGKTQNIVTKANILSEALDSSDCIMGSFDVSFPSAETKLYGGSLDVEVSRARAINIYDGETLAIKKSGYIQPLDILKQVGIKVYPEDIITSDLALDGFLTQAVGETLTIKRAPVYFIEVDGARNEIRSWKKTVGEVLEEKKVPLGIKDEIIPPKESILSGGEVVVVNRINEVETEETHTVNFQTVNKKDYDMYLGKSVVEQEGQNGQTKKKYKITYRNGEIVDKQLLESVTLSSPVNKVVRVGAKPYTHEDLWKIMVVAGPKYGVDPSDMFKVMMCESGGNTMSGAGTAYQGIFQWDSSFYKWSQIAGYGGANIFDPTAQIYATAARVSASGGWGAWGCKP